MTGFSCAWRGFRLLGSSSSRSTRKHAFASPCPQHAPTFETVQDPDDDWAPTFLTLFALLTVYCPDINEQKAIQQAGSTRRGKHLLMRGKVLYHVLVFEAERARYEGRLGDAEEILIGLKTLSAAIADRDHLFCLVTQTDGAQQAHLAPAADVDG